MTRLESLFPLGRWEELRRDAEAILRADTARGGSRVSAVCNVWLACLAAYTGDLQAAGAHLEAGAEAVLSSGDAQGETTTAMLGVVVSAARGDDDAVGVYADRLESSVASAGQFADFCAGGAALELVAAGRADRVGQ